MLVCALLYEGDKLMCEVSTPDGIETWTRKSPRHKWNRVHPTLNPTCADYLRNCQENFGWTIKYP